MIKIKHYLVKMAFDYYISPLWSMSFVRATCAPKFSRLYLVPCTLTVFSKSTVLWWMYVKIMYVKCMHTALYILSTLYYVNVTQFFVQLHVMCLTVYWRPWKIKGTKFKCLRILVLVWEVNNKIKCKCDQGSNRIQYCVGGFNTATVLWFFVSH